MSVFLNVTLACIAETFGDFKFKDYARQGGTQNFTQGILGYIGVLWYLIKSLKHANIIYINGLWDGISGLLETLAAYIFLRERLNTRTQYIGLGLIVVGLFMFKRKIV